MTTSHRENAALVFPELSFWPNQARCIWRLRFSVRTLAFDSHPECYVDAGFCQLPLSDWFAVAATIDGRDWLSRDAQRQLTTTARACLFGIDP